MLNCHFNSSHITFRANSSGKLCSNFTAIECEINNQKNFVVETYTKRFSITEKLRMAL